MRGVCIRTGEIKGGRRWLSLGALRRRFVKPNSLNWDLEMADSLKTGSKSNHCCSVWSSKAASHFSLPPTSVMSEWRNHWRREEREGRKKEGREAGVEAGGKRMALATGGENARRTIRRGDREVSRTSWCAHDGLQSSEGAPRGCSYQVTAQKTFFRRRENSRILPKHPVCGWPSAWFSFYSGTNVPWLGDRIVDWSLLWLEGHPKSPHLFCPQSRGWGVASQLHRFHTWVRERSGNSLFPDSHS